MNFEFHPDAERELHEAALGYELDLPGLGRRFGDEVERAVEVLLGNPEIGARLDDDLRHFVLRKFPFSIIYAASADLVSIIGIAHGSREPGYWRPRIHER